MTTALVALSLLLVAAVDLAACAGKVISVPMRVAPLSKAAAVAFSTKKMQRLAESKLAAAAKMNVSVPMNGNIYPTGVYYATMQIGTPAQQFNVVLDTGSGTLILPAVGCVGCDPSVPKFNPKSSTTITKVAANSASDCDNYFDPFASQCTFSNSYTTCVNSDPTEVCTESGPVWFDTFSIGGLSAQATLGSITTQTPSYKIEDTIDGLMGLAGHTSFGKPIPIAALAQTGAIDDVFALCWSNTTHGRFMLGGASPGTYRASQLRWLSLAGEYAVNMNGLSVGGVAIPFSQQDVVLDSGTNILLLDPTTYGAFQNQLTQCSNCAHVNSLFNGACHNLTASEVNAFPSLQLSLDAGVVLTMPPSSYLVPHTLHGGALCLAVLSSGAGGPIIVGDTTMWGYTLIFDRSNARVGIAPVIASGCQ
jgi:hypothetical protein